MVKYWSIRFMVYSNYQDALMTLFWHWLDNFSLHIARNGVENSAWGKTEPNVHWTLRSLRKNGCAKSSAGVHQHCFVCFYMCRCQWAQKADDQFVIPANGIGPVSSGWISGPANLSPTTFYRCEHHLLCDKYIFGTVKSPAKEQYCSA